MSNAFPGRNRRYLLTFPLAVLTSAFALLLPLPIVPLARAASLPSTGAATTAENLPRIGYRRRVLPNGLTVYAVERHGTPTVAVQVWYRVGSRNDPPDRSGFAHLFEHLMFKSTHHMPSEMFDRLTEDVGGTNNAETRDDVTIYQDEVPSNYLESILWAEADRMTNLNVDAANFQSERAVVEEEFRQRVEADSYGRLDYLMLPRRSYTTDPYGRPGIGSIEDLDRATLGDVRLFYTTWYRPDNAVIVVVGDFDPSRLDAWIDRYLAQVPKPAEPLPSTDAHEPARTDGPKRYSETAPVVPLPALAVTYLTPGTTSDDASALRVVDTILTGGDSSRLQHALVYEQQVASSVWSDADLNVDAGLFEIVATAAGGKDLDTVRTALLSEIERLKADGPTSAELTKARNQLIAAVLRERETNDGLAGALGTAAVLLGDPERINTSIARLSAVTADDVKAVLAKYATDTNRVEIRYTAVPPPPLPKSAPPATKKGAAKK